MHTTQRQLILAVTTASILIQIIAAPQASSQNETGLVISEAFVLRADGAGSNNELLGISTRGFLHDESFTDISVSSVIIGGTEPMTVVFRGRSTSISDTIQADKVSDTRIEVVRIGVGIIGSNDNWQDTENLHLLEGTSLDPTNIPMQDSESLLVMTDLLPGAYSVRVVSKPVDVPGPDDPPPPRTLSFTQSGTGFSWNLSGNDSASTQALGSQADFQTITARVGDTLTFSGEVGTEHPWHLRNASFQDLTTGLSGSPNGSVGTFTQTWNTTGYSPGTYHYQCGAHTFMIGDIVLTE